MSLSNIGVLYFSNFLYFQVFFECKNPCKILYFLPSVYNLNVVFFFYNLMNFVKCFNLEFSYFF